MPVPLADLDLNLLKVFDVLMEERGVSRAARRLGITQSSTSNALERLRRALDDRVLERSGNAMVPTRTAIELWPHVQLALAQIVTGLNSVGEFDPAALRQTVSIGMDEYSLAILGPPIEARLRAAAPRIRLVFLSATPHEDEQALFGGRLDLLIGPAWRPIAGLERSVLLHETFVAVVDADHPLVGERETTTLRIEDYVRYPHILVSRRGYVTGNVDDGMRQLGMRRTIATTTPYYASAPRFLHGTELILNLGRRLAREFAEGVGLRTFEIPMKVPGFDICLFWHPRNTRAKPHQWLRREIEAVATDVQATT